MSEAASAGVLRRTRRPSRRTMGAVAALAAVALAAFAVWLVDYRRYGRYVETTNDAYVRADTVTVSPRVAGYVDRIYVRDDQDVRSGQPLVRIDARDYRAQLARYGAQIDVAGANLANVAASRREQEAAIDQARAQLAAGRAQADFAAAEVARYAPLAASGAETREKLASLGNQAAQASAQVAAQAAALTSAKLRVASLNAQAQQARAQGEVARAQRDAAQVDVGAALIRAAVAGRIGDRGVRVGQFVQPGTRLMSVVPLGGIYVVADFKETQVGLMRAGQPARIRIDALDGVELRGHVESLSPGTGAQFSILPPQNATGNFTKIVQRVPVRIAIDAGAEARRVLVPGLSAEVSVDTRGGRDARDRVRRTEAR